MYSVFRPVLRSWRNRQLIAVLRTSIPSLFEMKPHWWLAQPIQTMLSPMIFAVDKKAPLLDNYQTDRDLDLYSEKLISIFNAAGVRFETFPTTLVDYRSNDVLSVKYEVFHLLERYRCADIQRSQDGPLALTEDCLHQDRPLFRLAEAPQIVLIRQDLQSALEAAQVTGCWYVPLSEYQKVALYPDLADEEKQPPHHLDDIP